MHVSSSEDLSSLEALLGYTFKKKSRLKQALTHKSYAHEKAHDRPSYNERLEFLGDSVLELIISEYLFTSYPEYTEADLSKIKAYVVQESTLAEAAKTLHIGNYLQLGKGEEMTGGRLKPSLLADAFEAVLAALYLDGGYKNSKEFVLSHLVDTIDTLRANNLIFDFKTRLQEVVQAHFGVLPRYVTHKEEGPEHKKTFEVKVYIRDTFLGSGTGKTKKAAAQKAAEKGLKKIEKES